MKHLLLFLLTIVSLSSAWHSASAQTRYISDELELNLRAGPSTGHRILRMLKSGTPVQVQEVGEVSGYSKVIANGKYEGWVLTRFLMDQPSAKDRLARAKNTIKVLKSSSSSAQTDLLALQEAHSKLKQEAERLVEENQQLNQELSRIRQISSNAVHLDRENAQLKQQLNTLTKDFKASQLKVSQLESQREKDWFIAGAGVLFFGMILGLILPKLRFKKKSSWGSL